MTSSARPTCFLSYARADDEAFVERLRDVLRSAPYGVEVWWDRVAMQSRGVSFLQEIDEAVRSVDRVVLVCGPAAAQSPYVQHELEVARRSCTVVVPVLRRGTRADVPDWLARHHSFDLREDDPRELAGLGRSVSRPRDPIASVPTGLPPVPETMMVNSATSEAIRLLLPALVDDERPAGDATGLRLAGLPGVGKTVAVGLIARDCDIRRSYFGGVHFVRVGTEAGAQAVVNDLRRSLGVRPGPGETDAEAVASLTQALVGARRLIILDDVWRSEQLRDVWAALAGGPHRLLFTSRSTDLGADLSISGLEMSLPDASDAAAFLARRLRIAEAELPSAAALVIDRCGHLPLALALCAAQLASGVSWADLASALETADPGVLGGEVSGYEYQGARAAMQVSVDRLFADEPQLANRYRQLALFRRGRPVPTDVIARLWEATDDADRRTVRRQLAKLAGWSLLVHNRATGDVVLHDLHRHYLRSSGMDERPLADRLLNAYGPDVGSLLRAAARDDWLRTELISLLSATERSAEIDALLGLTDIDGGHAWADLRGSRGELDALWEDLQLWSALGGTPREQLRRCARSTLMRSSIRSSSWRVAPRLLAAAVRSGLWTVEQAMDVTRRNPSVRQQVPARLELLESLPPERRFAVLREALDEVPELPYTELVERLRAVLAWGVPERIGVKECLDALAAAPPSRLGPQVFGLLATHVGEHRERAELLARRSPTPLAAAAALTRADPPGEAWERLEQLCANADLVGRVSIVVAATRPDIPQLTDFAEHLARLLLRDDTATTDRDVGLPELLPIVSDSCLSDLVDLAEVHGGLAAATFLSPLELYELLRRRLLRTGEVAGLWRAGLALDPRYLGIGLLARAAAVGVGPPGTGRATAQVAEVIRRLERDLSPDGLSDISDDVALLWPWLPDRLRERLVATAGEIRGAESRAWALVSFLPKLPTSRRRSLLERELTRLANHASGIWLDKALNLLADQLEADQVPLALSVATAARDDGFERAGFKWLIDALPPAAQPRAVTWTVRGAAGRLRQEGLGHEEELVDLLETLTDLGTPVPPEVDGTRLPDLVASLGAAELRARAFAALAVNTEDLWPRAEAELEKVDVDRLRLGVLSTWSRFATGERRTRYVARALELLPSADSHDQTAAIRKLIPVANLTAQADHLIEREDGDQLHRYLPDVAAALSLPVVTEVVDWYCDELDSRSAAAVARRLLDLGALVEAWSFLDRLPTRSRQNAVEASAPDLNADQVRSELDRQPTHRTRRTLLARLAALGHVEEALAGAQELTGVQRLHALALVAAAIPAKRPQLVAAQLDLLTTADQDSLVGCVRDVVPVLAELPVSERVDACRKVLDLLSQWPRLQALQPIYATAPLIAAAGGPEAVADIFDALLDVMRWWPSMARPSSAPQ